MAERTPSKPASTCSLSSKRAAFKCGLDRLKQAFNKVETLIGELAASKDSFGRYLVTTSSPRTPTPPAYPEPATPPGLWARTPGGQHDHEASGSNHTSNHTSEYFDAKDPFQLEYLQQYQISDYGEFEDARLRNRKQYGSEQEYEHAHQGIKQPQYGFSLGSELSQFGSEHPQFGTEHCLNGFDRLQQGIERPHPGLEEQLAGSFGNILLNTPTASHSSHPHPHPWDDPFLNPVAPEAVHHHHDPPVNEYYSGELNPSWFQVNDTIESHATSTAQQQQQQQTTTKTTTTPGCGAMSLRTGETGDSRESLMDTAGTSTMSPYILAPVEEEKSSVLPRPFNKIYVDLRRIIRRDDAPFASARIGRGLRVLGKIFCYTVRLRKTVMGMRLEKSKRKRIREPRPQKLRQQCMKRRRAGVVPTQPMTPGVSTQSTTEPRRYKGVTFRNGHWNAEIRVSACTANPKAKVWIGTFSSEKKAALALDAGYYHCTEKYRTFNFPQFVSQLGESQYPTVLALCDAGREKDAKKLVKRLAATHAAEFGES